MPLPAFVPDAATQSMMLSGKLQDFSDNIKRQNKDLEQDDDSSQSHPALKRRAGYQAVLNRYQPSPSGSITINP
jgi:hypothetical protein